MPRPCEHLVEEANGSAVDHVGEDDVVAGLEHGQQQGGDGGHAGAEADRAGRVLKRGDGLFEGIDGGIRPARIAETLGDADGLVDVGGGLVDGKQDGIRVSIARSPAVDGEGGGGQ